MTKCNVVADDPMIEGHLRSALKRIKRGDVDSLEGAQRNIEYARNRMRDLLGSFPQPRSENEDTDV